MVLDIGSPSEAWRALAKIADDSEEVAYDRTKREFETLETGVSESVAEYFALVHIVLMKLERYKITTPAREIRRIVFQNKANADSLCRFMEQNVCSRQKCKRHYEALRYLKQSFQALQKYKKKQGLKIQIKGRFTDKAN